MKKALKLALTFLFLGIPAQAAPSFVSGHFCSHTASGANATCVFSGNITAGNQLFACINRGATTGITWSGDSGTFVPTLVNVSWDSGTFHMDCWYVLSAGGGGTTLTATGTMTSGYIMGGEFTAAIGGIDQVDAGLTGTSAAVASNPVTTQANGELCIGVLVDASNVITPTGSWVAFTGATNTNFRMVWQVQSSKGSITATGSLTSNPWIGHIMTVYASVPITSKPFFPQIK